MVVEMWKHKFSLSDIDIDNCSVPVWQISKQQTANQESRHIHWLGGGSHPFLTTHKVPLKSVKARFTKNNLERSITFFVLQKMYNNQEIEQRNI